VEPPWIYKDAVEDNVASGVDGIVIPNWEAIMPPSN